MNDGAREFVPILRTKLHRPLLDADLVHRDRLLEVMGRADKVPLTLVSAPAGYGKSVLVAQWVEQLDVEVAYKEKVDRVIAVLKEVGEEMGADPEWQSFLLDPVEVPGVQLLGESGVQVRIFFKTQPEQKWNVTRELRRRIKNRFDAEGIEIPFPHRTVYFGTGETGSVRVESADPGGTRPPDRD